MYSLFLISPNDPFKMFNALNMFRQFALACAFAHLGPACDQCCDSLLAPFITPRHWRLSPIRNRSDNPKKIWQWSSGKWDYGAHREGRVHWHSVFSSFIRLLQMPERGFQPRWVLCTLSSEHEHQCSTPFEWVKVSPCSSLWGSLEVLVEKWITAKKDNQQQTGLHWDLIWQRSGHMHTHRQWLQKCKEPRKGKESYRGVVYDRGRMQQRKNVNPADQKIHLDKKEE